MTALDKKRELLARIRARRERGVHFFLNQTTRDEWIARHAYHTSVIEGRRVSQERLRKLAKAR